MASPFKIPQVPPRNSRKRNFDAFTKADRKEKQSLEKKIQAMTKTSKLESLKPRLSFDADYFGHISQFSELQCKKARLSRKQSLTDFMESSEDATEGAWAQTSEARKLAEKEASYELDAQLFREQADRRRIKKGDVDKVKRRHFMQEWTMSPRGFNIKNIGAGTRDPKVQRSFCQDLIIACGAKHPDPKMPKLWCPVIGDYVDKQNVIAAHMFPYSLGQTAMHNIFGLYDRNELFAIENGLLLCEDVEKRISMGLMAIVPNIPDRPSKDQVDEWRNLDPKPYKIRVVDSTHPIMDIYCPEQSRGEIHKTWIEMDGKPLLFRTDHRPRARYLYWQYYTSVLRNSWRAHKEKQGAMLKQEFNRAYWGTKGIFMDKVMLEGFAEEVGHTYEDLLEAYADEVAEKPDPEAVIIANIAIREIHPAKGEDDEEDEDEDYDDDDEAEDEDEDEDDEDNDDDEDY